MPLTKKFVSEKLKKASPTDLIQFNVKIPAYLLEEVRRHGDASKTIRKALKLSMKSKFKDSLTELTGDVRKEIDKLETVRDNEGEMDEAHLQLLELYKDVYFKLKKARILRKSK